MHTLNAQENAIGNLKYREISPQPSYNEKRNTWLNQQDNTSVDIKLVNSEIGIEAPVISSKTPSFELNNSNCRSLGSMKYFQMKMRKMCVKKQNDDYNILCVCFVPRPSI